jgi:hypothetical protein
VGRLGNGTRLQAERKGESGTYYLGGRGTSDTPCPSPALAEHSDSLGGLCTASLGKTAGEFAHGDQAQVGYLLATQITRPSAAATQVPLTSLVTSVYV